MSDPDSSEGQLSQMLLRGDVFDAHCPAREILKHITSRWGVLVLIALTQGTHRFSQLRRKIGGISEKMLAQTLDMLEHDGLVTRRSLPVIPPHVEYRLSALGEDVSEKVIGLTDWIEHKLPEIMQARGETVHWKK